MALRSPDPVEIAMTQAADAYAETNGLDRFTGGGIFLAGVVLASKLPPDVLAIMATEYLRQLPQAQRPLSEWAEYVMKAAGLDKRMRLSEVVALMADELGAPVIPWVPRIRAAAGIGGNE